MGTRYRYVGSLPSFTKRSCQAKILSDRILYIDTLRDYVIDGMILLQKCVLILLHIT